jgi:sporulation protein YlmC with PRC-barrel domain
MLIAAKHAYGVVLEGPQGRVGALYDVLFDDRTWKVRHLVVSIDRWFLGRQVLVDPPAVQRADWHDLKLSVRLTKEQIEQCPKVEKDLPVARQEEAAPSQSLVSEAYWPGPPQGDLHLRSTKILSGLHIHCTDGMLGHVDDFVVDDETWTLRHIVLETRNWWPGKHVLVHIGAIQSIRWADGEIHLSLSRQEVLALPPYEGFAPAEQPTG